MIVVDASAALSALLNAGQARRFLAREHFHVPYLIDYEVASGLHRRVQAQQVGADQGWHALDTWRHLAMTRYGVHTLLDRVWDLRDNVSTYDASYLALAEALDCTLVTADTRLSGANGIRCPITVVPR